ncbi:MAG: NUDIX hydrolase [candidate division WWE3 bacterium GW2011_GWC2_44_9]|uniref:8-oxo-dGTP diphosphatase n=1 Tax=candidate division WWE3 bacterium GW2011_GWC2_44_9 TaxID=1619125 RepID=A0A0G1KI57_UNCKA|nr:MAG: NUDIX hydrolase [candidate division WWE3 bacterium GW2011_GWC2_44_9]
MSIQHKVIVKAWVEKDGKYLLAQRGNTEKHHAGVWSLPGGNVENEVSESILEATLQKELSEEVGIEVEDKMDLIYNNGFVKDSDGSHVINLWSVPIKIDTILG